MHSGTWLLMLSATMSKMECLTKAFDVANITSRVGIGSANGLTNLLCSAFSCVDASSGIKVTPLPFSTILIKVSMLPNEYEAWLLSADFK